MATRTLLLRAGSPRDIDTVDALMEQAFDPRFGEGWTRAQCLGVLAMPGVRLLLAWLDDEPAGFALVRTVLDEVELLLLATVPAHRRRGVAATLLRALAGEARADGATRMHLEVRAGNDAAQLYLAQGFAKLGERRGYYRGRTGQLFDAHTYSLAL
ncbi:MAG: ribosomal-protein-alanine acetyltransferase [Sphingomonas bacterium]|uniref:GNAT family N-acetyltransferase n=1 Tax=Sphingomonas bacterium TaxID=1895847 RepID=UPI002607718D|nr:N-acetyltransferase [Sphingomonas bacterium]MDB5695818.1 ribosomal-protein-alanine acetyltransferase [Sphingomonas bacterium]